MTAAMISVLPEVFRRGCLLRAAIAIAARYGMVAAAITVAMPAMVQPMTMAAMVR